MQKSAKTKIRTILLPSTVAGAIVLLTGGSYILYATFKRKNFLTILKNKEIVRTMIKKECERQIKKAYIFYRRRVKTLLATGRYLLTIDYRKAVNILRVGASTLLGEAM